MGPASQIHRAPSILIPLSPSVMTSSRACPHFPTPWGTPPSSQIRDLEASAIAIPKHHHAPQRPASLLFFSFPGIPDGLLIGIAVSCLVVRQYCYCRLPGSSCRSQRRVRHGCSLRRSTCYLGSIDCEPCSRARCRMRHARSPDCC